jgi:hypothetical protein
MEMDGTRFVLVPFVESIDAYGLVAFGFGFVSSVY